LPFDSLRTIERRGDDTTNPMVNAGAIHSTGLVPGSPLDARWTFIEDGLSRFAGRRLAIDEEIYASAPSTNLRNRAIAQPLESVGRLGHDHDIGDVAAAADELNGVADGAMLHASPMDLVGADATIVAAARTGEPGARGARTNANDRR
jgi:hypothetical protein